MSEAEALRRMLEQLAAGADAVLITEGGEGQEVLAQLAGDMAGLQRRVLRATVASPDGISLSALMAQVTGQPDLAAQDDQTLEMGFNALTVLDEGCQGIVLLVSGAHRLHRATLRYVQFACRASKDLHLVLAGDPTLLDLLGGEEFASLRKRLAAYPALVLRAAAPVSAAPVSPIPLRQLPLEMPAAVPLHEHVPEHVPVPALSERARPALSTRQTGKRRVFAWTGVGLGLAASLALGIWIGRHGVQPASQPATRAAEAAPAVPAVTEPLPSLASVAPESQPVVAMAPPVPMPSPPPEDDSGSKAPMQDGAVASAPRTLARKPVGPEASQVGVRQAARPQPRPTSVLRAPARLARPDLPDEAAPDKAPDRWVSPQPTFDPLYTTTNRSGPFIGTYSTDTNGVRSFRLNP